MHIQKQATLKQNLVTTASSLVRFAYHDAEFATYFAALIKQNLPRDLLMAPATLHSTPFYLPADSDTAKARAEWLMSELLYFPSYRTDPVAQALVNWASERETPKDVVLGIIGLAIIGPTLGLVKKKKKKKNQMRIGVDRLTLQSASRTQLTELCQQASMSLLGNELAMVGGDTNRLDPELAEWLFVDQQTALYETRGKDMPGLLETLQREHLPHFALKADERILAIAVAPTVSETLVIGDKLEE